MVFQQLQQLTQNLDIATTILLLLLFLGAWILWRVQKNTTNNFNFEEMLRDESGKPSAFRLAIFVSLAVSTWVMMYITLKTHTLDTWMFVTYLSIWSGAKVAETAIVAYSNRGVGTQFPDGTSAYPGDYQSTAQNKYSRQYDRSDYQQTEPIPESPHNSTQEHISNEPNHRYR